MNDKTIELINGLAAKLGVTTEYLWAVLVAGKRVEGIVEAIFAVVLIGVTYAFYRIGKWGFYCEDTSYDSPKGPALCAGIIGGPISAIIALALISFAAIDLLAPEYAALREIFSMMRPK